MLLAMKWRSIHEQHKHAMMKYQVRNEKHCLYNFLRFTIITPLHFESRKECELNCRLVSGKQRKWPVYLAGVH